MYTHILIPTDGSDLAQKGVDHGVALAKLTDARVTFIIVTEDDRIYLGENSPNLKEFESTRQFNAKAAREALARAKAAADEAGVPAHTAHVENDRPSDSIVAAAKEHGCDLIVMASHGRGGLARLLLGGQTVGVLTYTDVPVLVVR